jgi:hypothetical protein
VFSGRCSRSQERALSRGAPQDRRESGKAPRDRPRPRSLAYTTYHPPARVGSSYIEDVPWLLVVRLLSHAPRANFHPSPSKRGHIKAKPGKADSPPPPPHPPPPPKQPGTWSLTPPLVAPWNGDARALRCARAHTCVKEVFPSAVVMST